MLKFLHNFKLNWNQPKNEKNILFGLLLLPNIDLINFINLTDFVDYFCGRISIN